MKTDEGIVVVERGSSMYGVGECWLTEQMTYEVEVLQFANRTVASRRMFAEEEPIQSVVLHGFDRTLAFIAGHPP